MGKIIDISYHNKDIDFAQLAKEVDLVIIRVQYGSNFEDPKHKEYVAACKKYGIPFGLYAYGHFVSVNDAIVEADDFYERGDKDALFWVLDTEDDTLKSCGTERVAEASQAFIDRLKSKGLKTGFYVSHHMYNSYGLNKVTADFKWIPRYGANDGQPHDKPDYPCEIWQYSDKGRIAGISTNVDLNELNGDKEIEYFTGAIKNAATGEIRYIYTGGFAGAALDEVHSYLFKTGHGYDAKRGPDGSLIFLIGPFDIGMKNYADCKAYFDGKGHYNKLLTREEAAEWKK